MLAVLRKCECLQIQFCFMLLGPPLYSLSGLTLHTQGGSLRKSLHGSTLFGSTGINVHRANEIVVVSCDLYTASYPYKYVGLVHEGEDRVHIMTTISIFLSVTAIIIAFHTDSKLNQHHQTLPPCMQRVWPATLYTSL